ncbi:MAG: hypothetical protein Q8S44_06615 [Flavobacteriaceae bacterium]|nr:hypothetical protein [Flavobacteriaceae bacterium]
MLNFYSVFKNLINIFVLLTVFNSFGQTKEYNLVKSQFYDIYTVDKDDVICLAKNTTKAKTLIYTFGIWCKPCIKSLPYAIKLAEDYNLDLYVLLLEKENDKRVIQAIDYLKKIKENINYLVLKDSKYGVKLHNKNKQFLTEITPIDFENIDDFSKFIIIDKTGKVLMVTNWKDKDKSRDTQKMIQNRILPILSNN